MFWTEHFFTVCCSGLSGKDCKLAVDVSWRSGDRRLDCSPVGLAQQTDCFRKLLVTVKRGLGHTRWRKGSGFPGDWSPLPEAMKHPEHGVSQLDSAAPVPDRCSRCPLAVCFPEG